MALLNQLFSKDRLTGLKRASVSVTTAGAGNGTLVAAVASKIIRVYGVVLSSSAAVNIKFQSGTGGTDLTGPLSLAANGGFSAAFVPVGHFQTAEGVLLNLNLDAAATVGGWLIYAEI